MSADQRSEVWRRMYRTNRYCRHLSQVELNRRIRDLFLNNLLLTSEAKVGVVLPDQAGTLGWERFTHVLEEMALRHGPYPGGFTRDIFHSEPFPDFIGELGKKAASVLSSRGLTNGDVYIKFGKADHMRSLLEQGSLRVQPASFYAKPDHNGAVRDDELSLMLSMVVTREDVVKTVVNPEDVPDVLADQRLDITYTADADYWLYSVTTSIEPRLFVDFNADSCVIIKDKDRFEAVLAETGAVAFPNAAHVSGAAIYVDPLLPTSSKVDIPMSKHFRYQYQEEHRFVWKPLRPATELEYVDVRLGSLEGFAELVVL